MRVAHPTLDGLSAAEFRRDVHMAAACVRDADPGVSEALAASCGL